MTKERKCLAPTVNEQSKQAKGLQVFNHSQFGNIRVVMSKSGEPLFVAKDVCDCLQLSNNRKALLSLDGDEKLTLLIVTSGQNRQMNTVNISGLFGLVFQSRKPEAKVFRKWITSEVIPALMKDGTYSIHPPIGGVYPIIYNGIVGYPRKELFEAAGYSIKSGSVSYLKKKNPENFVTICRTACVTPEFAKIRYEQGKQRQLTINFDEPKILEGRCEN